jgi:hypothetical protein
MRQWSRRILLAVGVFIVMVEVGVPQRVFAQRRTEVLPGLRFGPPLRAGLAVGVGYGDRTSSAEFAGPIVIAEAAVGGGRVSAGYFFAGPFASGIEFLGSAVRTWGSPSQVERGRTLVGGELRASFFFTNVGAVALRPISGSRDDRRTRYYLNVGFGI